MSQLTNGKPPTDRRPAPLERRSSPLVAPKLTIYRHAREWHGEHRQTAWGMRMTRKDDTTDLQIMCESFKEPPPNHLSRTEMSSKEGVYRFTSVPLSGVCQQEVYKKRQSQHLYGPRMRRIYEHGPLPLVWARLSKRVYIMQTTKSHP